VILFAQVAVDFNERLDGIALVLDIGSMTRDFRNDFGNESVLQRDIPAAKFLRKDLVPELGADFIAGGVGGDNLHGSIGGPVVLKRKKCEVQLFIRRSSDGETGEKMRADQYSAPGSVFGNPVDHTLGTTLIDVMLAFENLQCRRLRIDNKVLRELRLITVHEMSNR
jgi:hypothetical protein